MKKIRNIMFLLSILWIVLFVASIEIRGLKKTSSLENRNLQIRPSYSLQAFKNRQFQNEMEKFLVDQFILGETLKLEYQTRKSALSMDLVKALIKSDCKNKYIPCGKGNKYFFNCGEHMVSKGEEIERDILQKKIDNYSNIMEENKDVDFYIYYIPSSADLNFLTGKKYNYDYIKNGFVHVNNLKGIDNLKILNYEDFANYFYKTDHHWNHKGSYKGYKDITKMLKGEGELIKNYQEEVCFEGFYFFGSRARSAGNFSIEEPFCVYTFDDLDYISYINGEEKEYGKPELYFNVDNSNIEKAINHYGRFYGGDNAEVIYNFNNKGSSNLLIIAASFSNSINKLIASHFNKTYIIDLRHYKRTMGKEFDIKVYLKKNDISKVLFLGSSGFFKSNEFYLE